VGPRVLSWSGTQRLRRASRDPLANDHSNGHSYASGRSSERETVARVPSSARPSGRTSWRGTGWAVVSSSYLAFVVRIGTGMELAVRTT